MQHNKERSSAPSADGAARALEEYLAAAEAGAAPPRQQLLDRYPELADDLDACLAALDFIGRAVTGPCSIASSLSDMLPPEQDGGQLGDFRLIREVGRGGMGVVYEAEQVSLGRRVALKVLPFAATMDPRQLQRFHNEARAAALLDHPHIVHVHAVGCERAVHFYAMQFIDGQTLAALIAGLRRSGGRPVTPQEQATTPHVRGTPSPSADTAPRAAASTERAPLDRGHFRRVAEMGIQAAEALDHAHALGIVHRDVKPGNLLVDGRGCVWVTDFGLAHMQSDAHLTMTGDLVGTLRYMSPEQALAKRVVVDHRTDVYSLGATLYELLTLEPAFKGNDRQELLRQIAFEEPRPPRRLNRAVPAELETIALKAMEKNPAERYATAKDLADDLRRYLADEPIRARPVGVVRRARKWARRQPALVAALATALTVAVSMVSGGIGWVANDRATRRQATENVVIAALDESQSWQEQRRLPEALSAARRAVGLVAGSEVHEARRRQVDARVADLELLTRLEDVRLDFALILTVGADGNYRADNMRAEELYRAAFREADLDVEALTAADAGNRIRNTTVSTELAAALDDWAYQRLAINDPAEAGWRHLLQVARIADPDPWRMQLRSELERRDRSALLKLAASEEVFRLLPATLTCLAHALKNERAPAHALALLRKMQRRQPGDFWANFDLGFALGSAQPPDHDSAIRFYSAAVAIRPASPIARHNLGNALKAKGRLDEAIAEYREVIDAYPGNVLAHTLLGNALLEKRDIDSAIAAFHTAIRYKRDYYAAHGALGRALREKGDIDSAIAELRVAVRLKKDSAEFHNELGLALRDKGDADGAIAEYREAIRLNPGLVSAHTDLGNALHNKGDLEGAIAEFREAIRLKPDYANAHNNLGTVLMLKGDRDGALGAYRRAVSFKPHHPECLFNLGFTLRDRGELAEALTYLRRGHELALKNPRRSYPSAQWVKECERLLELEPKLPAILDGKAPPAKPDERLDYARLCEKKQFYASAARFYRDAFVMKPGLASPGGLRYDAACIAARAGCGKGKDVARPTDAERAELRNLALDWLRADRAVWKARLDKEPSRVRPAVAQTMQHWLHDADFNGLRGSEALSQLPEGERLAWQKLWQEVEALRKSAAASK
jgi:serine/threonine protein kinase/Flp pilus assembly protein TadD